MRTDRRRQGGILAMVASDPYRKLAAVGLAIGLWFLLNSQITRELPLRMPLTWIGEQEISDPSISRRLAVVVPTDRVIGQRFVVDDSPVDSVTVIVSGPRYLVDAIENDRLDLRVATRHVDWTKATSVEFTAADLQRSLKSLQDPEVSLTLNPPRIRFEAEKIEPFDVPLRLDGIELQVSPELEARLRRDTAKFTPDLARVLGPASSIQRFRASNVRPFRVRLASSGNARQASARLELTAPPELGLRLAENPTMTIQLAPVTKVFALELPVLVDDLSLPPELRGVYRPEKPTEFVRVRAGGALLSYLVSLGEEAENRKVRDWAMGHLRLEVWIEPPEPGTALGSELPREARLRLRGQLLATVEADDYGLDETLSVRLHRRP